jgi:hypothetical protein
MWLPPPKMNWTPSFGFGRVQPPGGLGGMGLLHEPGIVGGVPATSVEVGVPPTR